MMELICDQQIFCVEKGVSEHMFWYLSELLLILCESVIRAGEQVVWGWVWPLISEGATSAQDKWDDFQESSRCLTASLPMFLKVWARSLPSWAIFQADSESFHSSNRNAHPKSQNFHIPPDRASAACQAHRYRLKPEPVPLSLDWVELRPKAREQGKPLLTEEESLSLIRSRRLAKRYFLLLLSMVDGH